MSKNRSPILNSIRGIFNRGYANRDSYQLITEAQLPAELAALIDTTVSRTKLWSNERCEISQELIAHTQDALDAGCTTQEIINSFGDPKYIAKLLRRAAKRKRPLYWRTIRNIRRAVVALTCIMLISYAALAVQFFTGKPDIKTNYAAIINSQNDAYTEDEKAWPIYREIFLRWKSHIYKIEKTQYLYSRNFNYTIENGDEAISHGLSLYPKIARDHHDYQETAQLFKDFEPQLKLLREATRRPIIGIQLGFNYETDDLAEIEQFAPLAPPSNIPSKNPSLNNILLPHLGAIRQFANILAFDALIAAGESDGYRVCENISAMLAIVQQLDFDKKLIANLVSTAIDELAINTLLQVIHEYPECLSLDHMNAIANQLEIVRPSLAVELQGENMRFDDFLQRAYTDDGNGNGRITKEGMHMLINYNYGGWINSEAKITNMQIATGPISLAFIPNRKSQKTLYMNLTKTLKHVAKSGPQTIALMETQEKIIDTNATTIEGLRYSPVNLLMPDLRYLQQRSFLAQMKHDAAIAVLEIEIYKLDHDRLPTSIECLIPNYLATLPLDPFNPGKPLSYKTNSTGYLIYSVGGDGDDDNARHIDDHYFEERFPAVNTSLGNLLLDNNHNPILAPPIGQDGDWVLFESSPSIN